MRHTPTEQHPAKLDHVMEALRRTEEGESVAECLDLLFINGPPFELLGMPDSEWDYVRCVLRVLGTDRVLSSLVFRNAHHAFVVGVEMGEAVAAHGGT